MAKERMIFVNLPVKDLGRTMGFFKKLGFAFNPQFTNEKAACMVIGETNFVMLLMEDFFKGFLPGKGIVDASKSSEVLVALSADNRAEVDKMISDAVAAGGKEYREKQDLGYMYSRAFSDLDGHVWEVIYMDMNKLPPEMKNRK